jgi:hypothetical protein
MLEKASVAVNGVVRVILGRAQKIRNAGKVRNVLEIT